MLMSWAAIFSRFSNKTADSKMPDIAIAYNGVAQLRLNLNYLKATGPDEPKIAYRFLLTCMSYTFI